MEIFFLYILKISIALTLFYLCFKALFSNETFFRFNRIVLLSGVVVCLTLPFIRMETKAASSIQQPLLKLEQIFMEEDLPILSERIVISASNEEVLSKTPIAKAWTWKETLWTIYFGGFAACLFITLLSFYKTIRLIYDGRKLKQDHYTLVLSKKNITPFSWGKYIVLPETDYLNHCNEILTHEKAHLQHHHSIDLIFMEVVILDRKSTV